MSFFDLLELVRIESVLVVVELFVLGFLAFHTRELAKESKELKLTIKEMHKHHQETHKDTQAIKKVVSKLERDMVHVYESCDASHKKTTKK